MFKRLEGEDGGANLAGLAVPDQFDLAFVLEKDEPIFFRERLTCLNQFDGITLLSVGKLLLISFARAPHELAPVFSEACCKGRKRFRRVLVETNLIDENEVILLPVFFGSHSIG